MSEQPKKVLMVDDDIDLLDMYEPALKQAGYDIKTLCDSSKAIDVFKEFRPDIMFVDLAMEHFESGFVICHRIKTIPEGKDTPVIILTAAGHETGIRFTTSTDEETNWIKADDYLEKPISARDLLQYLNERVFK